MQDWNMEDAVRDLVRAIRGNTEANAALDRLAQSLPDERYGLDKFGEELVDRLHIERAALR